MNLPRKRLGYDVFISSSISQVESPKMRSHNTFTIGILFPRSCFTCESKILIDFTSNDKFVRMYGFKLEGGELFKGVFRKLFKLE